MKRVLKYLILFIVAVAFFEAPDRVDISEHCVQDKMIENVEISTFLSETDHDFCLPRQVSSSGLARLQSNTRRNDNIQRQSFEFVKSGKAINPNIIYFVQKITINTYSSLTDPAHLLACLGKLII